MYWQEHGRSYPMKINQIVRFHDENFFDGAVQLGWASKRPEQAELVARAFVFHGPKYHGAGSAEAEGIESSYRLKDTASFVNDLLLSIEAGLQGKDVNPYWLAVAGYGSGKSHLALTTSVLLSSPHSDAAQQILQHIRQADDDLANSVEERLLQLEKPALILPLDGMAGFHLGNALSQAVFAQFNQLGIDAEAIRSLSPRFKTAAQFAKRNFPIRKGEFAEYLPNLTIEQIVERLEQNDEATYDAVDAIYLEANGSNIPVEGQESAQELIETLSNVYCSEHGPFSQVIILFDEFGRYLEYAAEKPNLAGDAVLQQIFQGIQDNSTKIRFIGFIQYELKAYLKRFSGVDLKQLQRYITRFDAAEKWYLSSNLETIFAHMIGKDEPQLEKLWSNSNADQLAKSSWECLSLNIPGFKQYPVWSDFERFKTIIGQGCWPLHPMTVWFLSRQQDVVQSRSALTFIRDIIERTATQEAKSENHIRQVSVAELIIHNLLPELISAERQTGGTTAETLQALLDKLSGHLSDADQLVMSGVAALEKMRIGKKNKTDTETLLGESTALPESQLKQSLQTLSELGAVEWNGDLGQYELLSDGASRGQFQQWVRKGLANYNASHIRDLFIRHAANIEGLQEVRPDFAKSRHISTPEWFFAKESANSSNIEQVIREAFADWKNAALPNEPRGKVIYLYLHNDDDIAATHEKVREVMSQQLALASMNKAPVWVITLNDQHGIMAEQLAKLHLFTEVISESDKERYRRFLSTDLPQCHRTLKDATEDAIRERNYLAAGFSELPERRLTQTGSAIFEAVYPQTIPFPFDGFSSAAGKGAIHTALLSKGLITQQLSVAWLKSQDVPLQNRTQSVLGNYWGTLLPNIKLCPPKNPQVKTVYALLEKLHKEQPTRSLYDSYKLLLAPPHGMNAASANLMIALFLGMETPPRRIEYNGELIAAAEWLNIVYKTGKGKNYFESAVLSQSRVRFLSEDSESRWRTLLHKWEAEEHFGQKIQLAAEAKKMLQVDPLPEQLEGNYKYLRDESNKVSLLLLERKKEIESWEINIEKAIRKEATRDAIHLAHKLKSASDEMTASEQWPEELIMACDKLLPIALEVVNQGVTTWITRQVCGSYLHINEFRELNEKTAHRLKSLGLVRESEMLTKQTISSISRIENLQKYSLTLSESEDFPRQPLPDNSTPVRQLRDLISRGESLIESLKSATTAMTQEEISARCEPIQKRIVALEAAVKSRRDELEQLLRTPNDELGLKELLLKAERFQALFVGTQDQADISEMIIQAQRMLADLNEWGAEASLSPERTKAVISRQIEQQLIDFNAFLDDAEYDPLWDTRSLYEKCLEDRITKAARKSEHWVTLRLLTNDELQHQDYEQCLQMQRELTELPVFLAESDKEVALAFKETIEQRIGEFEEVKRQKSAQEWLNSLIRLETVETTSLFDARQQLAQLQNLPSYLGDHERNYAEELRVALTQRVDHLSMDDIINRIQHLTTSQQQELFSKLKNMLHG